MIYRHTLMQTALKKLDDGARFDNDRTSSDEYQMAAYVVRSLLPGNAIDTLAALIKYGPLVGHACNSGRNLLVDHGLAVSVVLGGGADNFYAATPRGSTVLNAKIDEPAMFTDGDAGGRGRGYPPPRVMGMEVGGGIADTMAKDAAYHAAQDTQPNGEKS